MDCWSANEPGAKFGPNCSLIWKVPRRFLQSSLPSGEFFEWISAERLLSQTHYYLKITKSLMLLLMKKMQFGYKRCKNYLKYYLKQTEKRNEKRGSISYATRTAKYSPIQEQPSVPGVSLYVPLGRVIPWSDHFSDKLNPLAIKRRQEIISGIRTSHASLCYSIWPMGLTCSLVPLFVFRFSFQIIILASFVPGLIEPILAPLSNEYGTLIGLL